MILLHIYCKQEGTLLHSCNVEAVPRVGEVVRFLGNRSGYKVESVLWQLGAATSVVMLVSLLP